MGHARGIGLGFWSALAAAALMATAVSVAPAAPLDQQTCDQLKREVVQLEGLGARDNLGKGAVWGKANLRSQQLEQVKKLIEMDEAIAFRCPIPKPEPPVAPVVTKVKGKAPAKAAAKPPATASAPAAAQAKPKPRPKPKAAAATTDGGSGAAAPRQQAKPKPPAPKRTDAYSPPPKAAAQ